MNQVFMDVEGDLIPREGVEAVYVETVGWWLWRRWTVNVDYKEGPTAGYVYSFATRWEAEACMNEVKHKLGWTT